VRQLAARQMQTLVRRIRRRLHHCLADRADRLALRLADPADRLAADRLAWLLLLAHLLAAELLYRTRQFSDTHTF